MRLATTLALLALIAVASVNASTRLTVLRPLELADKIAELNKKLDPRTPEDDLNVVECELANFGSVQYGSRIIGEVQIAKPIDACDKAEFTRRSTDEYSSRIPFLMIERGGKCSFVDKVFNAQEIGAQVVVIADNIDERAKIIMVDNGHGMNVHITSVFISKQYATIVKEFAETYPNRSISFSLEISQKKQEESKVRFWIDLKSPLSKTMIKHFHNERKKILNNTFTSEPIFEITKRKTIYSDSDCKQIGTEQFCAPDPDEHQIPGQPSNTRNVATGFDVIEEVIRQQCILQQGEDAWFDYYLKFANDCSHAPQYYQSCGKTIIHKLQGFKNETFEQCSTSKTEQSKILNRLTLINEEYSIFQWPAVTVNELIYRGNLDGHGIAEFVCNSLNKVDNNCLRLIDPNFVDPNVNSETINEDGSSSIFWTLFFILLGFVTLFLAMTFAYKKIVKREISQDMNQQVNQMVSQYIAFYESRGKGNSTESSDL